MKTKNVRKPGEIEKRNRQESARVWSVLESEGVTEKSAAEVLEQFSKSGFPSTIEGILRMLAPLRARYGIPKISSSVYPHPPSPRPLNWQKLGMRWSFEFPNGQIISVVIGNDSKTLIKRSYEDNGDIHIGDVIKTLRSWQKSIEQKQHGGRKNDGQLFELFQEWKAVGFDTKQKARIRKKYTETQPDPFLASSQFDQAMSRYKRQLNR